MRYITHPDFMPSVSDLYRNHANARGSASKALATWAKTQNEAHDFFGENEIFNLRQTPENRIPHCQKYRLDQNCRLITVLDRNIRIFLFSGTHDECDQWLERNRDIDFVSTIDNVIAEYCHQPSPIQNPIIVSHEKIREIRNDIHYLRQQIEEYTSLGYKNSLNFNESHRALEKNTKSFSQDDAILFKNKLHIIEYNIKEHKTATAKQDISETEFFMNLFSLKLEYIDKLRLLINLTKPAH